MSADLFERPFYFRSLHRLFCRVLTMATQRSRGYLQGLAGFCQMVEKPVFSVLKTALAKIVLAGIVTKINSCYAIFFLCTFS